MNVQVENRELNGNYHLGAEGSEIAFLVAVSTFFSHLLVNFSNSGKIKGSLVSIAHTGKGFPFCISPSL